MSPRREAIDDNHQWWLKFVPKFKEWSDVNISRLLNIYKAHSILWDPTHSFYTDEPKRMKAYARIVKRINLYGVKERDCMKLLESLESLYAEEKEIQAIAKGCSQKFSPPPFWYSMFEEMTECVRTRLGELAKKGSVQVEPMKPWETCCPKLYNEDIWTPKHFRTNVTGWFTTSQEERLLCTCKEPSETDSEDASSTEISSTCHRNSESDSSCGIIQCGDPKRSPSSISCCCGTHGSIELPEQCGVNVKYDQTHTSCNNDERRKMPERIGVFCNGHHDKPAQCPSKNIKAPNTGINIVCCSEEISDDLQQAASAEKMCCRDRTDLQKYRRHKRKTEKMKCQDQNKRSRNKKLVSSGEYTRMILCGAEPNLPNDSGSPMACGMNDASVSTDTNVSAASRCGESRDVNHRLCSQGSTFRPCGPKRVPKFCTMKTTTERNEGSVIDSSNSKTSSSSESHDTCISLSEGDATPATSDSSSRNRKSVCSECASIPEKEESDHRLDHLSDPTLCEKCAVGRVPVPRAHEKVVQLEDPRIRKLDKYCRYRDWDEIYNIRSRVPDDDPATVQIDEDRLLTKRSNDEPSRPTRQNHLLTEADINLFMDPKSSEAREVSLKTEYKWENGITIRVNQPRHYACEASQAPGHKPAQLML